MTALATVASGSRQVQRKRGARLSLKIGQSVEVMWLRHGDPLPEGYAPADSDVVEHHHKHHARLIYRTFPVKHRGEGER